MRNRRAFTLIELIVSIAVAGVIALLVYGSAAAGIDSRDALERHRERGESTLRARTLLTDALRHATDEADAGAPAFELIDATDARGMPTDGLTFLTRGVVPPLGASSRWTMIVRPTPAGLLIRAASTPTAAGISAVLRDVRGLEVEVMGLVDRAWSTEWPSSGQLPAAVRLALFDSTGARVGAPLIARIGTEAGR
jgi:prepilin-type N-terminal cleavage/methylation domain-containing protein